MIDTVDNVSWIAESASAVGLALNAGEAQKQADLLADARTELERILSSFQDLRQSADVVRTLSWEGRMPSPELSRDLDQARQTLDSRPLTRVQGALDQFGREVAASLKEQWSRHAAERLGDFADLLALSETLSEVEGIAEVSQQLNATLGELARSQRSLPTSQSVQQLAHAERLLQRLKSSLRPDGVRRFLSAVAQGGAPLESLTPDVTNWLEVHHSLDRFRVVAGSPDRDAHV